MHSVLILMMNLGAVCSFDIAYLINPELFPTVMLASAYGACNIFGRLITIGSPLVAKLSNPKPVLILMIYSIVAIILSTRLVKKSFE